jgi:hypothetical protein
MIKLKKIYYALLFLVVVATLFFAVYKFWIKKNQNNPAVNVSQNPIISQTQQQPVPTMPAGIDETLNNLRKNSKLIYQNESGKGYSLEENNDYKILMFDNKETTFLISLNVIDNIPEIRSKAENDFLKILNVNKEEACNLKVSLSVPKEASTTQVGVDYGLSFCPSGIQFEP